MTISSTSSTDPLANSRWDTTDTTGTTKKTGLDQKDFLALLTKQLAYQDPFKPADNDQMISQMASFATVDGINSVSDQFGSLNEVMTSSQALQASTLVGQKVLVPTDTGYLDGNGSGMSGMLTSSDNMKNVTVRIEDQNGQLIKTLDLGDQSAGNVKIDWDGTDSSGKAMPAGNYVIKAQALVGQDRVDLPVAAYANVESVTLGSASSGGVVLNLQGMGGIKLSDVLEVAKA
ncbi:flagellar hook assembly protein FlgD [Gallaecimonas kandeliae]|uniref:flagellar hook assembly protein FlgD n=1 Tax=Gallaecimonas kandeliae TaxID=3029055 RepID=UPI002648C34C|nr:flagellar hook assembly protein FlgD [Gallaecimonas kandeliae]WKE66709.1 flagellar hook assembly protein FlgD [Gallaecimonas kandeliae]